MFFSGSTSTRKVGYRGRSKAEETRDEILERTRLEREARKRQKLEHKSSTSVQAAWRGWRSRQRTLAAAQAAWDQRYGSNAELVSESCLLLQSDFLQALLFFTRAQLLRDVERLAVAAHAVSVALRGAGQQPLMAALHSGDPQGAARLMFRLKKLALQCLQALAEHRATFQTALASPKPSARGGSGTSPAVFLIDAILALIDPKSYTAAHAASPGSPPCPAVAGGGAARLAADVVLHLATHGAAGYLQQVLAVATRTSSATPSLPYAETLGTQLLARMLALKGWLQPSPSLGVHRVLFVPLLFSKCTSLAPVATRLTRRGVAELAGHAGGNGAGLVRLLPDGVPGGKAGAVVALLGNLLQLGARTLQPVPDNEPAAAVRDNAARLTRVLQTCLCLIPLAPFFTTANTPTAAVADEDGDALTDARGTTGALRLAAANSGQHHPRLAFEEDGELLPAEVVTQLQSVRGSAGLLLLRQLVLAVLPLDLRSPVTRLEEGPSDTAVAARAAYDLCVLVRTLASLPGQRQHVPLSLVPTDFVSRLWVNFLRPGRVAELAAWHRAAPPGSAPPLAPAWPVTSLVQHEASDASGPAGAHVYDPAGDDPGWLVPLTVCCAVFSTHIMTADLDEFYLRQQPLPLAELHNPARPAAGFLAMLKDCLWQVLWVDANIPLGDGTSISVLRDEFAMSAGRLYGELYDRNCRTAFCPTEAFIEGSLPREQFSLEASTVRAAAGKLDGSGRIWRVLRRAPSLVPFEERARVFSQEVAGDRQLFREMEDRQWLEMAEMDQNMATQYHQQRFIRIRRNQVLFDGFDRLNNLGEALRGRVRVQFTNEHGEVEAGVDGGGLFKEFIEQLMKEGFNAQYGLFCVNANNQLYPNPASYSVVEDAPRLLEFLGRMLGKAMYEGILVELPLAGFFLKKFRGGFCDINDLPTLDPEVYRNLTLLRHYNGDFADLALTFTATDSSYGNTMEVELMPDGRNVPVTGDNVVAYIHRVADYRLNRQLRRPVNDFLRGFFTVVRKEWVAMFNEEELQMLVSGANTDALDLTDMQQNVEYAGGYHAEHPVMGCFWEALASFTPEQQRKFLKFVSACSRPPLLGFKYLEPHLCIQMAGSMLDATSPERLPTSATCMNLLKLPPYRTAGVMRAKLLYAIESGAGFDLS